MYVYTHAYYVYVCIYIYMRTQRAHTSEPLGQGGHQIRRRQRPYSWRQSTTCRPGSCPACSRPPQHWICPGRESQQDFWSLLWKVMIRQGCVFSLRSTRAHDGHLTSVKPSFGRWRRLSLMQEGGPTSVLRKPGDRRLKLNPPS